MVGNLLSFIMTSFLIIIITLLSSSVRTEFVCVGLSCSNRNLKPVIKNAKYELLAFGVIGLTEG